MPEPAAGGCALIAAADMFTASPYALVAFGGYMVGVFTLGALAHKLLSRGSFLKEYFLGDRQLNAWVLGLTYVATSVSAGSFVGFPSLIYRNGWIMAVWIGGYMVGGLVSKGTLAKRLNQVSRLTGAITVPDVLRDRFQSPLLGTLSSVFLLFFLLFNLIGQFKAGGVIMQQACSGVTDTSAYQAVHAAAGEAVTRIGLWNPETAAASNDPFYGMGYPHYVVGVLIFAVTVIVYTTYGGFWAVTWTDVLQGIVIVLGALLLMILALVKVGGLGTATAKLREIDPALVTGPGPNNFLPIGLSVSFFFLWTLGAMGQPVGMVRLMACRDTPTLRTSLFMIGIYFALIYFPLVVTFICARALYPTQFVGNSDVIMPTMAISVTEKWPVLGGLILAAPYSAAMSAVAGFLLLMSSSLVRDIYQRNINPNVSRRVVRWISYGTTFVVGIIVTFAALRPPPLLQYVIVFTTSGMACTFLGPVVLALYWRRATRAGALAAALGGFLTLASLYVIGSVEAYRHSDGAFKAIQFVPVYLFGVDPVVYGLLASFVFGVGVSLVTKPLPEKYVDRYFLADTPAAS
jgi:sodium/pantothenate symporter